MDVACTCMRVYACLLAIGTRGESEEEVVVEGREEFSSPCVVICLFFQLSIYRKLTGMIL